MRGRWVVAGLLALTLVAGASLGIQHIVRGGAPAESGWDLTSDRLTVEGPITAWGGRSLSADELYMLDPPDTTGAVASMGLDRASVTVYSENRTRVENPAGGPISYVPDGRTRTHHLQSPELTIDGRPNSQSLITIEDPTLTSLPDRILFPLPQDRGEAELCLGSHPKCRTAYDFPRATELGLGSETRTLDLDGSSSMSARLLEGVRVDAVGANSSFQGEAGSEKSSPEEGDAAATRERRTAIYLSGEHGQGDLQVPQAHAMGLKGPILSGASRLFLPEANGAIQVGDEKIRLQGADVMISGNMTLQLLQQRPTDDLLGGSSVVIWGEADAIQINGAAYEPRETLPHQAALWTLLALAALGAATRWREVAVVAAGRLYTRLTRNDVLENESRELILAVVREHPGIHFRKLMRETGLVPGTLQHHAGHLEDHGLLRSEKLGGFRIFFAADHEAPAEARTLALLDNPTRAHIVDELQAHPEGRTQLDLCSALDVSQSTISYHLSKLVDGGLVGKEPGPPNQYVLSEALQISTPDLCEDRQRVEQRPEESAPNMQSTFSPDVPTPGTEGSGR